MILLVYSNLNTRIDRVSKRNKITIKKIKEIMNMQMPEKEKMKRADFILYNNSSKNALKKDTKFLYNLFNGILNKK